MRWVLALALVLHFTGLPAVGGMVCSGAAAGEHSCCHKSPEQPGDRVSSHCGCAVAPNVLAEHRRPLGVAPEPRDADGAEPSHRAGLGGGPVCCDHPSRDVTPPLSTATAFLSGAGFRC